MDNLNNMNDEDKKITEETKAEAPEVMVSTDKSEEYLNNWKQERADFINYKKDEARRVEQFVRFANEDVILEAIEIVDDLEIAHQNFAKQNLGGQAGELNKGLEQIVTKFKELFRKYGVEEIAVSGQKFNPELHEAMETEPGGEKMVQLRTGYTMHGKVIRPSRVKITK